MTTDCDSVKESRGATSSPAMVAQTAVIETTALTEPIARDNLLNPVVQLLQRCDSVDGTLDNDLSKSKTRQWMKGMDAAMDKRIAATKAFYATLSPEQQKTFDTEHSKMGPRGGVGMGDKGHRGMDAKPAPAGK